MGKSIVTDPINYSRAGSFMKELPDHRSTTSSKKYFVGGTFSIDLIWYWLNQKDFSGLMFWFGLVKPGNDQNYFVGLEPKFNFPYEEKHVLTYRPEWYKILVPGDRFSFSLPQNRDFEKFLKNDKQRPHILDEFISPKEMETYRQNFLRDNDYGPFHNAGLAYFINEVLYNGIEIAMIETFIKQGEIKYMRYYIGYNIEDDPYHLRLILVPVDINGKNVVINKKTLEDQTILLQNSWPPKPQNLTE